MRLPLYVAVVAYVHVVALPFPPSKRRPVPAAPENQVVFASGHPLFLHVEREYEDVAVRVRHPAPARAPGVVGEPSHRLPELRAHQHQSIPQPITLLVKGRGPELIFGGSEKEINFGRVS